MKAKKRIKQYFWGVVVLCIDFSKSINKEADIPDTPELISESFDLSIKRFSSSVSASPLKVI